MQLDERKAEPAVRPVSPQPLPIVAALNDNTQQVPRRERGFRTVGRWLAANPKVAIGLGIDQHPFDATFGLSGTKLTSWTQLSTNAFRLLAAGSQGGNAKLFAINASDARMHAMVFDATGTLNSGFFPMPEAQLLVVAVSV